MRDYRKELDTLREEIARLRRNRVRLETLLGQEAEARAETERLCGVWNREQKDVDDLERLTFAALWARLSGRKEERLEREEAEACAARMKYEAAERQLAEIRAEIAGCQEQLRQDADCEKRFRQVLREKQEALKVENSAAAERIRALEERLTELVSRQRELEEARSAGDTVRCCLDQVMNALGSAESWGTWDVLGGGFLTDVMKYDRLDDAQRGMQQLQSALRRYRRELADVAALHIGDFRPDGLTMALDIWFDNIFTDWTVLDSISRARDQVDVLYQQVRNTQGQLNVEFQETCRERDAARRELDDLVERA